MSRNWALSIYISTHTHTQIDTHNKAARYLKCHERSKTWARQQNVPWCKLSEGPGKKTRKKSEFTEVYRRGKAGAFPQPWDGGMEERCVRDQHDGEEACMHLLIRSNPRTRMWSSLMGSAPWNSEVTFCIPTGSPCPCCKWGLLGVVSMGNGVAISPHWACPSRCAHHPSHHRWLPTLPSLGIGWWEIRVFSTYW